MEVPVAPEAMEYLEGVLTANKKMDAQADDAQFTVPGGLSGKEQTPWLKFTGFPQHLAGINTRALIFRTFIPHRRRLQELSVESAIVKHLNSIFEKMHHGTVGITPVILDWLSSDKALEVGRKPFAPVQNITTWNEYTRYWTRLFFYLFSVYSSLKEGSCPEPLKTIFEGCFNGRMWAAIVEIFEVLEIPEQEREEEEEEADIEELMEDFMLMILRQM
jgi:hypothetical protein